MVLLVADGTDNEIYAYTDAGTYTSANNISISSAAQQGDDYLLFVYDDLLYTVRTDRDFSAADADAFSLETGSIGNRESGDDINFSGGSSGSKRAKGVAVLGTTLWVRYTDECEAYSLTTGNHLTTGLRQFTVSAFGASNVNSDASGLAVANGVYYLGDTTTGTGVTDGPAIRAYSTTGINQVTRDTTRDIILPSSVVPSGLAIVGNNAQLAVCDASSTERILLYDL